MDRWAAAEGHLVIFDRNAKSRKEKVYRRIEEFDGTLPAGIPRFNPLPTTTLPATLAVTRNWEARRALLATVASIV